MNSQDEFAGRSSQTQGGAPAMGAGRGAEPPGLPPRELPSVWVGGVTEDQVLAQAHAIRNGACPLCKKQQSPVDLREEHWVWSALVVTRYGRKTRLCCHDCGRANNLRALGKNAVLGWWGFPFGLLITPYKIGMNLHGYFRKDGNAPSAELQRWVRSRLVERN
jgi:hypothetical protein